MPLVGTFDVLDFGEVLNLLSQRAATGRLHIRAGSTHGTIWLAQGQGVGVDVPAAEDMCFDALRSARGSFEFHPEDEGAVPPGQRVRLEDIVAAGRRRIEEWAEVEATIHSFEAVPRLAERIPEDSVTLTQEQWRVLVGADGRRNVAALARRLDQDVLEFCRHLKPLVESGAVVLDQPEGWLKSLPKVRIDEVLVVAASEPPVDSVGPVEPVDSRRWRLRGRRLSVAPNG